MRSSKNPPEAWVVVAAENQTLPCCQVLSRLRLHCDLCPSCLITSTRTCGAHTSWREPPEQHRAMLSDLGEVPCVGEVQSGLASL